MKCPACDYSNVDGINFCGMCGEDLEQAASARVWSLDSSSGEMRCRACENLNPPENVVCEICGTDLCAADTVAPWRGANRQTAPRPVQPDYRRPASAVPAYQSPPQPNHAAAPPAPTRICPHCSFGVTDFSTAHCPRCGKSLFAGSGMSGAGGEDVPSNLLNAIALCFWPVGLCIWVVLLASGNSPRKTGSVLGWSIIGFFAGIFLLGLLTVMGGKSGP